MKKNDEMKNKIEEEFLRRMQTSKIDAGDKAAILAELNAKMANINDAMATEEEAQNAALQEMLAKRRSKKEKLKGKIQILAKKKSLEDSHYNKKLLDIAKAADADKDNIESELKNFKKSEEREIASELKEKRKE